MRDVPHSKSKRARCARYGTACITEEHWLLLSLHAPAPSGTLHIEEQHDHSRPHSCVNAEHYYHGYPSKLHTIVPWWQTPRQPCAPRIAEMQPKGQFLGAILTASAHTPVVRRSHLDDWRVQPPPLRNRRCGRNSGVLSTDAYTAVLTLSRYQHVASKSAHERGRGTYTAAATSIPSSATTTRPGAHIMSGFLGAW